LKLAESNSEDDIKKVTLEAFETYKNGGFNVTKAINKLTTLRGIGPATASLLLSVHDAAKVVFFGDEVFQWICHDGKKVPIKYNLKEYEELVSSSRKIIDRLAVDARNVEKVGFVLVREAPASEREVKEDGTTTKTPTEKKARRKPEPAPPKEPTEMTAERKSQLVKVAAKGRAARVAKKLARLTKGAKFRERVDAARARRKDEPESSTPAPKMGTKRKSEVTTRGLAASTKRSKRSDA